MALGTDVAYWIGKPPGGVQRGTRDVTANPAQNWSLQYSVGHLISPEVLHPEEDVRRMTASIMSTAR